MAALNQPSGYRLENGFLWVADDTEAARVAWRDLNEAETAADLCKHRRTVVQAGGNMGVWPLHLSKTFDRVITFEPCPVNFRALVWNTAEATNVLALPFALSDRHGEWCDLERTSGNAGAHQVVQGINIPVMDIDALGLDDVDLIYLDIEGSEMAALKGAEATIKRCHPVIAFEDKGHSLRYGVKEGATEAFLMALGYRVHSRPKRDVIMVSG